MATPDDRPTVPSLDTDEMPRMPSGTRPLKLPFRLTDGTRRLISVMSLAFTLASVSLDTTAADTGTSESFSVRFSAVITISSSCAPCSGAAVAAVACWAELGKP